MTHVEAVSEDSVSSLPRYTRATEAFEKTQGRVPLPEFIGQVRSLLRGRYEGQAELLVSEAMSKAAAELAARGYISVYRQGDAGRKRNFVSYPAAYQLILQNMLAVIETKTRFPWKYADSKKRIEAALGIPHVEPQKQVRTVQVEKQATKSKPVIERNVEQISAMVSSTLTYGGSTTLIKQVIDELGITDTTNGVTLISEKTRMYSTELQIRILEALKRRPRLIHANPTIGKRIDALINTRLRPQMNSEDTTDERA